MFFFELIQIALGVRTTFSKEPANADWNEAYQMAVKHALVGLCFTAVEKLNRDNEALKPPMPLFYQWMGDVLQIEAQNKALDLAAERLTRIFKTGGLRSCVLKGQGIARLYPCPERRQPGDIDLWVEGGRKKVLKFLKDNFFDIGDVVIHHVDTHIVEGVESEIHFIPVYVHNPLIHTRLQRYFKDKAEEQFSNMDEQLGFAYPTLAFNAVYILAHIYMHFLYEGIGLRQLIDYYQVLINMSEEDRGIAVNEIKKVGLKKIAGAVIFVLAQIFGSNEKINLFKPDEKRGRMLYREIIQNGNLGKYDVCLKGRDENNLIKFNILAFRRQLKFIRFFPLDVISIPFFKVGHWCWRKINGYV